MNDLAANDDLTEGLIKQKAMEAFSLDQESSSCGNYNLRFKRFIKWK